MNARVDKRVRILTVSGLMLFGLLSIVASGGGDGGTEETTFGATSSGVAAKGIIQYGAVSAEELNSSGGVVATVGTAETGVDGRYSLTIGSNYNGGPLLLTISGKSDSSTKMKCDVSAGCGSGINFGDQLTLDTSFSMTAIVPPVADGASISAQITPFTHMAARRAKAVVTAGGSMDADAVNNAISEVNQMVGVNILDVEPVDITDATQLGTASSEALAYAAFVAGAGELAFSNVSGLQAGLEDLASSFEDGVLDDTDAVNPAELLAAVDTEATAGGIASDPVLTQVLATMLDGISGDCATNCSYNPEPADTATQTNVEKARAVVAQTRAWGTTLEGLETPMDAFGTNMDAASAVLDANSMDLLETLGLVLDAVGAELDAQATAGSLTLTTYTVSVIDSTATNLGTATVTLSDNSGLNMAIAGTGLGGVDVALTATSNVPADEVLALANTGATLTLSGLDLSITGSVANAQASMTLDQMVFTSAFDANLLVDPNAATQPAPVLTSASLDGGLTLQASGARFSGTAKIVFVALTSPPSVIDDASLSKVSLASIDLTGEFSDGTGNSFSARAGLKVNNAADFDTLGALACGDAEWVGDSLMGDALGAAAYISGVPASGIVTLEYASYSSWSGETHFQGLDAASFPVSYTEPGDVLGVTARVMAMNALTDCGVAPSEARDVNYNYWASYGYSTINGELVFPPVESASSFANLTLTLTMDLSLTGYPDTSVVLTANRTALEGGDLTATFAHQGQNITFVVSKADGATAGEGTLTVTTPDGAKLAVTASEGATTGTVKINGATVGTVEETGSGLIMVRYNDGTFETLQ